MAKPNLERFLELAQRSELVTREQLSRVIDRIEVETGSRPSEPEPLGDKLVEAGLITRWQCDKLREGRHKGFFLKRYRLLDHLGSGGMSHVYLAEHVLMQRRVAIKVLPKERVQDSSYLERFHRESQAAAALDHRNIVRAYDVDNEGDVHFMVMEYVDGDDLQAMVRQDGPLDYPLAADYIRQAAEGLEHAHQAGLIHRDVKPANLLVDRNKVVKLLDLGLARFTGEDRASLTVAYDENVLGTADFLAPEQALDSHGVDARADIYSLGCSFYYVLAGRPPFPDGTLPQRLMMHQKQPPPSIQQVRPDAPDDLVQICLKMVAKKPEDRFQSAAEVADALAEWLAVHGHALGSGSSSGRLTAARPGKLTRARKLDADEEITAVRKKGSSAPQRGAAGSGPNQSKPLAGSETLADRTGSTSPGSGSTPRRSQGKGKRKPAAARKDEPVIVEPAVPEFLIQAESPAIERLKTGRTTTREEYEAYRLKRKQTPIWVWSIIAGGGVLAVILLLLVLLAG
jgi:serine/threonine-protein kinase